MLQFIFSLLINKYYKLNIPIIVQAMQTNPFQKFVNYQNLDYVLSPRSVSSRSNLNSYTEHNAHHHRSNYTKMQTLLQASCRQKYPKKYQGQNYLKDFVIWPKDRYERNDFQPFPARNLKRYDSNKLNDIGKYKIQLTRSKSVSEMQQKSRIQILGHIQKVLQDESHQKNLNPQEYYTETKQAKSFLRQNIQNRISRLEQYLFKIRNERQRQKIKTNLHQTLEQNSNVQGSRKTQKVDQILVDQLERRRIQNMKFLIKKLQEVKNEVLEIKNLRQIQAIPKQNYTNVNNNIAHPQKETQKYENNQLKNGFFSIGEKFAMHPGHNYPPSVARFKSKMQGNQLKIPQYSQNMQISQNRQIKLIKGEQKFKNSSRTKPKINFTFGSKHSPALEFQQSASRKVSPFLILD